MYMVNIAIQQFDKIMSFHTFIYFFFALKLIDLESERHVCKYAVTSLMFIY